ncbi:MAG: bifunctional oligoribonuclease/PAP phosphatase NrnA [Thermoleophilia bacterium]|nr:bifunctional oligoribonuclease/PAP phosphatase NrnA [Thermoleophilia bacterium]
MSRPDRHRGEPGADMTEIIALLADPGRAVTVTTHRKPDGDAIGSMVGIARVLRTIGHDVVMWHAEGPGVPADLQWLLRDDEQVVSGSIADHRERVLVSVDAATPHRITDSDPSDLGEVIINIDHHHDNPHWGHHNLVDGDASSTAEIVVRVADALGVEIDESIALPLYVGLVTDTGRFSYSSTGPEAHAVAARLVATGVDPGAVFRQVYEGVPLVDLHVLGRGLAAAREELDGRLIVTVLTEEDVRSAGGGNSDGVVEALRAVRGADVAALIRQVPDGQWRVSMRASGDTVDVSAIAALEGGGGHRAAAGFTSRRDPDGIVALICDAMQGGDA